MSENHAPDVPPRTEPIGRDSAGTTAVCGFRLDVLDGPDRGRDFIASTRRCTLGVHPSCDFVFDDPTISRFHCEIVSDDSRVRVRDLGSSNGTLVDGLRVLDVFLKNGSILQLGRTAVRVGFRGQPTRIPLSPHTRFGALVGRSPAMRGMFALLERAASADATVLLQGETGTGKTAIARALHLESTRKDGSFVVVDCSALPGNLLESELFGHEKGAFTGALGRRIGAFEEADKGTLFLDEIGELSLDLQAKLLGVLEGRVVRRIGNNSGREVDIRIIAATNRDLRAEVNQGRFREDLYYRLCVLTIDVPPLRERLDDLPELVPALLAKLNVPDERITHLSTREFIASLGSSAWPGNVRELRNHLQQYLIFGPDGMLHDSSELPGASHVGPGSEAHDDSSVPTSAADDAYHIPVSAAEPFSDARQQILSSFERLYVTDLLRRHQGRVTRAATAAGVSRAYLYRLLQRHRIPY